MFNITACDALKRSLPTYSRNLTAETQVQLCRDLGVAATFHQLTAILYLHIDVIDNDIQTHGVACTKNRKKKTKNRNRRADSKEKNGNQNSRANATTSYQQRTGVKEVSSRQKDFPPYVQN